MINPLPNPQKQIPPQQLQRKKSSTQMKRLKRRQIRSQRDWAKRCSHHTQRPTEAYGYECQVKTGDKQPSSSMMNWIAHFLIGYPSLTGCHHPMEENLIQNRMLNQNKTPPNPNKWNGATQEEILDSNSYVASIQFLMQQE